MDIRLTDSSGRSLQEAVADCLQKIQAKLQRSGKLIQQALLWTTKNHISAMWPGSKHYDPNKVTQYQSFDGTSTSGEIKIAIPGICRAYHSHDIHPIRSKHLTIPMHRAAYGKKASEVDGLFYLRKKNGNEFLARSQNGKLQFMYFLAKSVHQNQDRRLMPSDNTFRHNIASRISAYLKRSKI